MVEMTDDQQDEVMRVTKEILIFLADRRVDPDIASAALIQAMLELHKSIGNYATIDEAAQHLLGIFQRGLKRSAN
ncbi:hypothetical protein [Bradyrhizobium diazoefficiens]|uniref:hypothetical protein n=1 Tax=Bradyrhizobium diazoefficiens TaxID=1355477 RepID=UPI00272A9994|nr:hypothetical protein [Bradyrhizobium diazoefficiens]WLA62363.1 hypothetical protein QNN01_28270 [Bradyrhizobium diazoefficiens]